MAHTARNRCYAASLGRHDSRHIHEGELEAAQIGVQWRINRSALDEWLRQRSNRPERWLTPQEIADRLRINHKTVVRHIRAGELKAVRIGSRGDWRIKESDLMVFLEESTRHPDEQD